MSDAATRTIDGRYEIFERIGSGGMADVYRGRDVLLERDVAVKVLIPHLAVDPYFVDRFRREASSAASLHHPNVVAFYDFGTTEDTYYIVMELVDGRTLAEVVLEQGPLEGRRTARIAADVCAALEAAHGAGLIHRDITTSNIMLADSGTAKVADFGIATALREDERTTAGRGPFVGTATYLSPEQAAGHSVDERTDLYSLGVVLYEMVTGVPPFSGEGPVAVASQHVLSEPPRPALLVSDLPEGLEAIVLKALAKDPDARHATAAAMRGELERVVAGRPAHTTLVLDEPLVSTHARRGPSLLALTCMLLVALSAVAGGWLVFDESTREQNRLPDLGQRSLIAAQRRLDRYDVFMEIEMRYSDQPRGLVIEQSPRQGTEVLAGDTVHLVVSRGFEPRLTGHLTEGILDVVDEANLALRLAVEGVNTVIDR